MAVIEVHEDIFTSPSQTLVCPVNVAGAMGAGLALTFKEKAPEFFYRYRRLCHAKKLTIDKLWIWTWPETGQRLLALPTKGHWSECSNRDIVLGNLVKLVAYHERLGITSLAIPPVGCGLGGLDYKTQIRKEMIEILSELPFEVRITLGEK